MLNCKHSILAISIIIWIGYSMAVLYSQDPKLINFQGRLEQNGIAVEGDVSMTFSIYASQNGGSALWSETHDTVKVKKGVYNVLLGSVLGLPNTLFNGESRYLGVKIGNEDELLPRFEFTSVGYSQYSFNSFKTEQIPNPQGDLSGLYPNVTVRGILHYPISFLPFQTPSDGDIIQFSDSTWWLTSASNIPGPPTGPAGGDLEGSYPYPTIRDDIGLRLESLITGTPSYYPAVGDIVADHDIVADGRILCTNNNGGIKVRMSNLTGFGYGELYGANGGFNIGMSTLVNYPNNGYIALFNATSNPQFQTIRAGMYLNQNGQGIVFADNLESPSDNIENPGSSIWYSYIKGAEAGAYVRGTAKLLNGRVTVNLPEHFRSVAISEGMTVQLTPLSSESKGLAAVEKTVEHITVAELNNGTGTYEFDYLIMAVRKGYENYKVVRDKNMDTPQPFMDEEIEVKERSEKR